VDDAADQVLRKLWWCRLGDEVSERQWRDVLAILRVQGDAERRANRRALTLFSSSHARRNVSERVPAWRVTGFPLTLGCCRPIFTVPGKPSSPRTPMNQGRLARWRVSRVPAVLVLVLVLTTAACSGDDDGASAGATTTVTIDVEVNDTTTSTLPATTTTTTTVSEADRFRTIAVDLWTARNELYQNPPTDPEAALVEIFDRQCDCFQAELDDLTELATNGEYISGPPASPLGVRFSDLDRDTRTALVHLALDASPRQLLATDGAVIDELSGGAPFAVALGLIEREGRWLIDIVAPLQVDATFVEALIGEGLP